MMMNMNMKNEGNDTDKNKSKKMLQMRVSNYIKKGELDLAENDLVNLMEMDNKNSMTFYLLGCIAEKKGELEHSVIYLTNAIEIDEGNVNAIYLRASVYNKLGEYTKAIQDYYDALEKDQNHKNIIEYNENEMRMKRRNKPMIEVKDNDDDDNKYNNKIESPVKNQIENGSCIGIITPSMKSHEINTLPSYDKKSIAKISDISGAKSTIRSQPKKEDNNSNGRIMTLSNETNRKQSKPVFLKLPSNGLINTNNHTPNGSNLPNASLHNKASTPITNSYPQYISTSSNIKMPSYNTSKPSITLSPKTNANTITNQQPSIIRSSIKLTSTSPTPITIASSKQCEKYYNQGTISSKSQNYKQAIDYFTQCMKLNPKHFNAYYNRAFVYDKLSQYQNAIEDYTQAIAINPTFPYAYFNRGIAYDKLSQFQAALDDYSLAINQTKNSKEIKGSIVVYLNRALLYKNKFNDFNSAIEDYDHVILIDPSNSKAVYNRGLCYYAMKNWVHAEKDLKEYVRLVHVTPLNGHINDSTIGNAYHLLGDICSEMNKGKEAVEYYNKAIGIDGNNAKVHYCLGKQLVLLNSQSEDLSQAIEHFDKAISLDSSNDLYYESRSNAYIIINEYDLALTDISKAIQFNSTNCKSYETRASVYKSLLNYKEAINDYSSMLSLEKDNMTALINRAFCYGKINEYPQAMKDYESILSSEPDNVHALYNHAILMEKSGHIEDAIEEFGKVIDLEPMNAKAYLNRGCCYEKLNYMELANKDYESSLLIDKLDRN